VLMAEGKGSDSAALYSQPDSGASTEQGEVLGGFGGRGDTGPIRPQLPATTDSKNSSNPLN
jgi:hypothetical protein